MARYSNKAQEKVEENMHEMKKGTLRSGSGKKVTNPKQAIAIGLSEARKAGAKTPAPKKAAGKRSAAKKSPGTKKGVTKSAAKKKPAPKKRSRS